MAGEPQGPKGGPSRRRASLPDWSAFPGAELVAEGLRQLARDERGQEALAVLLAKRRLTGLGLAIACGSPACAAPDTALYDLLCRAHGDAAHARFNAVRRELVSFAEALETALARQ